MDSFFSFLLFSSLLFSSSLVFAKSFSIQQQCNALLHLKQGFDYSALSSKTRLPSWNPDNRDCCSWEGITCDGANGHVTSLDLSELNLLGRIDFASLFRLQNLQRLNLASNQFDGSTIPSGFEQLTSLTHLNLSWLHLYGQIPLEISRLTTLVSLDLSQNFDSNHSNNECLQLESIGAFVQNLSSLRELHLSGVNVSVQGSEWGLALSSALPLLHKLSLKDCHLSGRIHSSIFRLPNLQTLDVGYNPLLTGEIPPNNTLRELSLSHTGVCSNLRDSLSNSKMLTMIQVSDCKLAGQFPSWIVKLEKLMHLDLSDNGFSGPLPSWLEKLRKLVHLDLSHNGFSGPLPSSLVKLDKLVVLDLSHNGFSGPLPSWLVKLDKLAVLDLSSNNFSGPIPSSYGNEFQNLQLLSVYTNSLSGTIPSSLFSLPSLQTVDLSGNQFTGQLDEFQYTSSSVLWVISLSNNSLNGTIPLSLFSLPSLKMLFLQNNHFSGQLGEFHNPSSSLLTINLDNNKLEGPIPMFISEITTLRYLSLSSNDFSGDVDLGLFQSLKNLRALFLSNNKLEGSIPIPPPSATIYSLAKNHFSGEVPSHICNCTSLEFLDLSHNRFNGSIPYCLGEISDSLTVLNLGGNAFHGTLIQTFKEGCTIKTLDLNGNQVEGQVPKSLAKCKMLEVLNLGDNQIHDTFPFWLENLSQLRVLILRSNKFHGSVGHSLTNLTFPMLQIFDLSSNSFTGSLPSNMFRSWKVMKEDKSQLMVLGKMLDTWSYYQDKVTLVWKGLQMEVVKIIIAFTLIDLSNNEFHGGIPESIGDLKSLLALNMSHNHFTGRIPISFGNIKALESLDMSQNNLSGEIPLHLNQLTFLTVLNLSHNLLVGSIPQGQQFNTFTNQSFLGNLKLCGPPLSNKCKDIKALLPLAQSESEYDWKIMAIGFGIGYGVGMGVLFWTLTFWTRCFLY